MLFKMRVQRETSETFEILSGGKNFPSEKFHNHIVFRRVRNWLIIHFRLLDNLPKFSSLHNSYLGLLGN